jgi:hypothetical protein
MHSEQVELSSPTVPVSRTQRLLDKLMIAFGQSCEQRDVEVATHLLQAAEVLLERPIPRLQIDRRKYTERLVAARARLWLLRHSGSTAAAPNSGAGSQSEMEPADQVMVGDPVLKGGRLTAGLSEISCLVLRLSDAGAEVRLAVPWAPPERLVLRLCDGTSHPARFRWSRGLLLGLGFTDTARHIQGHLHEAHLAETFHILEAEQFFWDDTLRRAAEDMAAAHDRLKAALRPYAGRGSA